MGCVEIWDGMVGDRLKSCLKQPARAIYGKKLLLSDKTADIDDQPKKLIMGVPLGPNTQIRVQYVYSGKKRVILFIMYFFEHPNYRQQ